MSYTHLINKAKKLRQDTFMAFVEHGEAHLGGSFSMIEILIALFEETMVDEDKFILSKAHASFPLCLLLKEKGLNPSMSTHLEIDPDNGIHCTTGSLGHGLPIATGMALARSIKDQKGTIYVMMSDGECQEGTTWESLLIGAKHKLHNLTVIIDYNNIQALTTLSDGLPLDDLALKFRAFNWDCDVIEDGHSFEEIIDVFQRTGNRTRRKPRSIIANTTKSKGIKSFENDPRWHARKIKGEELEIGKKELGL
jgi:transketolase